MFVVFLKDAILMNILICCIIICRHVVCSIFRLTGKISSIVPVSETRVLFSAELPLESLCKQQDTFVLPDLLNSNSNGPIRNSFADEEILRPTGSESSVTEQLFNLPRNTNVRVT